MGYNRWILRCLIICAILLNVSGHASAQEILADSTSVKASSPKTFHLAIKCNVATSMLAGESEIFPIHRTTSLPLTTIGAMVWTGKPFSYYFTTGIQMGEYQFRGQDYRDRMMMLWGYFGLGFMMGSGRVKLYNELDPMFRIHQWYSVYAREPTGRHWIHATPLDLFPFWEFRDDLGLSFKISDFWLGLYYQFSLEKVKKPNVLRATNLHFRSAGVTIWIPIKEFHL